MRELCPKFKKIRRFFYKRPIFRRDAIYFINVQQNNSFYSPSSDIAIPNIADRSAVAY